MMSSTHPLTVSEITPSAPRTATPAEVEFAFVPSLAWEPSALAAAAAAIVEDDDDADITRLSPSTVTLRFQLEPSTHGAVGDAVPAQAAASSSATVPAATNLPGSPEVVLLDEEKKRLERERKDKRRELLSRTVYVRGLPASMPQAEFAAMLLDCGPYNRVRICGNAPEGQNYIYGFVEFATTTGAERMMVKSGTELSNGTARAPLRLDCTRVKRPIMDNVAEDADPDRGAPCTFGLPLPHEDGAAVRTLVDALHVVPPSVQAKAALRKGIERCACGCDGDSCCACCRCFSKAVNKNDGETKPARAEPSCCGGCGTTAPLATGTDASGSANTGDCCTSSSASNTTFDPSLPPPDLEVLLTQRKEELEACTRGLCAALLLSPVATEAEHAWTALCERLREDTDHPRIRSRIGEQALSDPKEVVSVHAVELLRLRFFVVLITASLLLSHRRASTALALLTSLKDLLHAVISLARTAEQCDYVCSIACFAALTLETLDIPLALSFYTLAQTFQKLEANTITPESRSAEDTTRRTAQQVALVRLVANLSGETPYVPPEENPTVRELLRLQHRFFANAVRSDVSGNAADMTTLPRWIVAQVCAWKAHVDALQNTHDDNGMT